MGLLFIAGSTLVQELVWLLLHDGDVKTAGEIPTFMRCGIMERCMNKEDNPVLNRIMPTPSPRVVKTHLPIHLAPQVHNLKSSKVHVYKFDAQFHLNRFYND